MTIQADKSTQTRAGAGDGAYVFRFRDVDVRCQVTDGVWEVRGVVEVGESG